MVGMGLVWAVRLAFASPGRVGPGGAGGGGMVGGGLDLERRRGREGWWWWSGSWYPANQAS